MSQRELLEKIAALGRVFRSKGMTSHARRLRVFWLAARHGLLAGKNELDVRWSEAHVIDWMRTLRLPPYERELEVRPKGSGCRACERTSSVPSSRTVLVWPEGARLRCDQCGAEWLELDG